MDRILNSGLRATRVVILGGGTGLSTVVGGNADKPDWSNHPFVGLKEQFRNLDVVVGTTDDGGSTGRLLRQLPMIAIGDLRKSFVSLILESNLKKRYAIGGDRVLDLVRLIQCVFSFRFSVERSDLGILRNPLLAAPPSLRSICPGPLAKALRALGSFLAPGGKGPPIDPAGHSLGNLLLTASIFRAAGGRTGRAPCLREIREGLNELGGLIGVSASRLHPGTVTPGQLKFRYANGVEVYGQSKSASARRGCPVERMAAEYVGEPVVSATVCGAIRNADLIIYAPGSLYTSIIPVLQLRPIIEAIRGNKKALKILGANFWIQEGETDLSPRHENRGFLVSDLIEAYERNVPGGAGGLFHIVLSANLDQLPGNILRNYALEGKIPIHLDRERVVKMGFQPFEAALFSSEPQNPDRVIHHDPVRFAEAVCALLVGRHGAGAIKGRSRSRPLKLPASPGRWPFPKQQRCIPLCRYLDAIRSSLQGKHFAPVQLKDLLLELAWENRDIRPAHLGFFAGAKVLAAGEWNRSTAWDNILGYFDPEDGFLKIHEQLLFEPAGLRADLLIALGESLLGRYIESRRWLGSNGPSTYGMRCYQVRLRPPDQREAYLPDAPLRKYLGLARMIPDPRDPLAFQITLNDNEGFLPPGLLFGMLYAWYLNNRYASLMEYEMSILRWSPHGLIPHQAAERVRKQALVEFFRTEVFGHPGA